MLYPCLASLCPKARSIFNKAVRGLEEGESRQLPSGQVARTTAGHYTLHMEGIEMVFWSASDGEQVIPCTVEQGNYYDLMADIFPNGEVERLYSSEKQARLKELADQWVISSFEGMETQLAFSIAV